MRVISFFSTFCILLFSFLFSQPLNGTFTVGTNGETYASIQTAITDLETNGIDGPVRLVLSPETFQEQITLSPIVGSSAINTLTISGEVGETENTIWTWPSEAGFPPNNFILNLDQVTYISLENISFTRSGTLANASCISMNDCQDINFDNCIFSTKTLTATTPFPQATLISANDNQSVSILNSQFLKGDHAVRYLHSAGTLGSGLRIVNNYFQGQSYTSILVHDQAAPIISNNTHEGTTDFTIGTKAVLNLEDCEGAFQVTNNQFSGDELANTLVLENINLTTTETGKIENNFFQSNGTRTIWLIQAARIRVAHNSVMERSGVGVAFFTTGFSSINLELLNNNFISLGGHCVELETATSITADYNNLYTTGLNLAFLGQFEQNLPDWRTLSGLDANSISQDPLFVANDDMHLTAASPVQAGGIPIVDILTDIDGNDRPFPNGTFPDIGADEFFEGNILAISVDLQGRWNTETGTADLFWQLEGAGSGSVFILERKLIDQNWNPVAQLPFQLERCCYSFSDPIRKEGNTLYRIRVISSDNQISLSNLVEIAVPFSTQSITLYPNPTTDILNLTSTCDIGEPTYRVFSIDGKLLSSGALSSSGAINCESQLTLSWLSQGLYFIEITGIDHFSIHSFQKN
ncbi:MAG: T9SS type A sorting domain-containing protein [Bacteroidota bacterium]